MPTYRTFEPRTDRILKDWILKERLAFNLEPSLSVSELQAILPPRCKEQLGEFKPTDNIFRKMSQGFNRVSDVWIELMRFIGVSDFSPEQAIFGTVSTFLDSENVRVKLNASYDAPSRRNSIEVLCLNEPTHQGLIRYEGDRLSFPPSIFEAVIDRRLNVYNLYCENLSDLLLIPGVSDPQSLLIAENDARLAEENKGSNEQAELDEIEGLKNLRRLMRNEQPEIGEIKSEDVWIDSYDAELEEAERIEKEAQEAEPEPEPDETNASGVSAKDPWMDSPEGTIEGIYKPDGSTVYETELGQDDIREYIELIGSLMTDDAEASDDAIVLTSFGAAENDPDVQNQMLAEAIEDSVNGHGYSIDDDAEYDAAELEAARSEEAARDTYLEEMAEVRDRNQLMTGLDDEEISDDAIALTPYNDVANDPETTPFGGAVNLRVYHMIPFDESAEIDAARLAEEHHRLEEEARLDEIDGFLGVSDEMDSSDAEVDANAEIETAVDGHGFEVDEADGEVEDFDEDWDSTGSTL